MYNIFQSRGIGKDDENVRESSEISKNLSLVLQHTLRQENKIHFNIPKSNNVRKGRRKLNAKNIFITVISNRTI
jgi:hypothetical protein